MRYKIIVVEPNAWHPDGTPVVVRESNSLHRSLRAAYRKLGELIDYNPRTRMWSAAWHRAFITEVFPDGTFRYGLSPQDRERLADIEQEERYR